MSGPVAWWRHSVLAGLVAGLAASPFLPAPPGTLFCGAVLSVGLGLAARGSIGESLRERAPRRRHRGAAAFLAAAAGLGGIAGLAVGSARVAAIGDGALPGIAGERVELRAFVAGVPRRGYGEVRVALDSSAGRVVAVAPEPVGDLPVGSEVRVSGRLAEPAGFRASELARAGARFELRTGGIELTGGRRAGFAGLLDRTRERAEAALSRGVSPAQGELAKGFVLGQDDRIDPATREDFRRSGLSHLLAVSGQNVALLAILAGFLLAPFGLRLRHRLLITVLLIAVYVPVAGAGPSIQRAGVMGAAVIVATLAGRPADRAYPPLLAAAITLAIDPRAAGDVGWQLSFAAVVGIMLWAAPLRELLAERLRGPLPAALAGPLSDGVALTLAATIATAPLIAHDFERLSVTSLPANVLALPAIAPVMWLGMLIGLLGQLPGLPPPFLGSLEGVLIDYVSWVAGAFAAPGWSEVAVGLPSTGGLIAVYLLTSLAVGLAIAWLRRHRGLSPGGGVAGAVLALGLISAALLLPGLLWPATAARPAPGTLRLVELDVGQGDATLLQPARGDPVLIDGGPPGGAAVEGLRDRGIDRLRAVIVSHDDRDHSGGVYEVLEALEVDRLVRAVPASRLEAAATASGARVIAVAEGSSIRFGRLQVDVLWPPRERLDQPSAEANEDSLVLAAGFGGYDVLLTGDAEAETTRIDPGPFDVLKVAHHGSEDAGLPDLLAHSVPRLALIGVGAGNPYGHPAPGTLQALLEHGACTLRTDLDGAITVELGAGGLSAATEAGPPPGERPGCITGAG